MNNIVTRNEIRLYYYDKNIKDLQILLERVNGKCKKLDFTINTEKTKSLIVSNCPILTLFSHRMEYKNRRFKNIYFGSVINEQMNPDEKIYITNRNYSKQIFQVFFNIYKHKSKHLYQTIVY